MKKIGLLLLCCHFAFAQTDKDFHHRRPLTVEELLEINNAKAFKSITAKSPFMVVSNYRNGKRWRYFEGEVFRFKTKDGRYFEEELAMIEDSTFTVYRYNKQEQKMDHFTFRTKDVKAVYKNKRGGGAKVALLSMTPILPMALLDWAVYNNPPLKNKDFLWITPIVGAGNLLIFKHKNLFNKQKMGENRTLRIIRPY
jgi:hypothetical protein